MVPRHPSLSFGVDARIVNQRRAPVPRALWFDVTSPANMHQTLRGAELAEPPCAILPPRLFPRLAPHNGPSVTFKRRYFHVVSQASPDLYTFANSAHCFFGLCLCSANLRSCADGNHAIQLWSGCTGQSL